MKFSSIWIGLAIFAFVCLWMMCGCADPMAQPEEGSSKWDSRQRVADNITCHWSTKQIKEGACWCIENAYHQGGIVLAPNKFCGR